MLSIKLDKVYTHTELMNIPSLTLAFVGDAYFSLLVRTALLGHCNAKPTKLHRLSSQIVNAQAQSKILEDILPKLTSTENDVVRRARNAPNNTKSKHYGLADYKRATALEALIGYLYLLGHNDRLNELLQPLIKSIGENV
ncbi:MAG: Mini-ribonuclease 3 [Clostridia bacterium]|nr:Mini-ribonuclease 3 [Clostridia bacterium]